MGILKKSKSKAKNGYVYEVSIAYKDLYDVYSVIGKVDLKQKISIRT